MTLFFSEASSDAFSPNRATLRAVLVAGLLLALIATEVQAASLRCDNTILREGAHLYEVSELCGEPVAAFQRVESLHPNVLVYVDEWVYRLGSNKFQRMLRFENGRLRSIQTLRKPRARPFRGKNGSSKSAEYRISY